LRRLDHASGIRQTNRLPRQKLSESVETQKPQYVGDRFIDPSTCPVVALGKPTEINGRHFASQPSRGSTSTSYGALFGSRWTEGMLGK
jgi:hypothetical protein